MMSINNGRLCTEAALLTGVQTAVVCQVKQSGYEGVCFIYDTADLPRLR